MRRNDIVTALIAQGYKAEAKETVKNGVIFEGIIVRSDEQIAPIIYTQSLIDEAEKRGTPLSEVVEQILRIYETNKNITFNVDELFDREFVLSHIHIALQKDSEQNLVRKSSCLEGIEEYLYLFAKGIVLRYITIRQQDVAFFSAIEVETVVSALLDAQGIVIAEFYHRAEVLFVSATESTMQPRRPEQHVFGNNDPEYGSGLGGLDGTRLWNDRGRIVHVRHHKQRRLQRRKRCTGYGCNPEFLSSERNP